MRQQRAKSKLEKCKYKRCTYKRLYPAARPKYCAKHVDVAYSNAVIPTKITLAQRIRSFIFIHK